MKKYPVLSPVAGFTLPELMLVLAIITLLAGSGGYYWQRWRYHQQLSDTAAQLHSFLSGLRDYAGRYSRDLPLAVRPFNRSWCIDAHPDPVVRDCRETGRFVWIAPYPEVNLLQVRGEPGFYGQHSTARAGSIEFGQPENRWRIIISARARIRVCRPPQEECL